MGLSNTLAKVIKGNGNKLKTKIHNFMKNVDSTMVMCDKIGNFTVISNLACPP